MLEVSDKSPLQPCERCGCLRWPLAECWGCLELQSVRRRSYTWIGWRVGLVALVVVVALVAARDAAAKVVGL